jgi:hypothetical protein
MAFEGSDRLLGIVTSPKPLLELIAHQCAGVISHRDCTPFDVAGRDVAVMLC